jgi:hypothetical protein
MQLHIDAELFGNFIVRYSEVTSKYHIGAKIDVNRPRQDFDITCLLEQIEHLARAPFPLKSPEEETKKTEA